MNARCGKKVASDPQKISCWFGPPACRIAGSQAAWWLTSLLVIVSFGAISPAQADPRKNGGELQVITQLAAQKQWQSASQAIATYRQNHPEAIDGALLQAEILIHLGLLSDANEVLQHILAAHPHCVAILSAYARLSQKLNNNAAAEEILLRATKYDPHSSATWKQLGDFYLSQSRAQAATAFQHAISLAPHDAAALAGLAASLHQQGDDAGAMRTFKQAVQENDSTPADPMVDFLFAEFLLDRTDYTQAPKHYRRALELDPSLTAARIGRAKALMHLQEFASAENDLRVAQQDNEFQIESLNLLTKVYQAQGKINDAQDAAAQAEKLSAEQNAFKAASNNIASALQNADALAQQNKFAAAASAYADLAQKHPEVVAGWLGLARCDAELGRTVDAEAAARHAVAGSGNSAAAHVLLGKILLRQGKSEVARAQFLAAQEIDPLLVDARVGLAASYIVEGRFGTAIPILRSAKSIPGADISPRLMLTEALFKSGQRETALREINEAIKKYPGNQSAANLRDSLMHQPTAPLH